MAQVEEANTAGRVLVLKYRPDPAAGRPDRLARRARAVHRLVIRQHEVRTLADVQPPLDVDSRLDESADLVEQGIGVEHDAVPDRAPHAGMQDPARDLVQHEGTVTEVDGVPGVRSSL